MLNVDVSRLKASFYLSKFCLLRLRHVLCLRVRDADVAFILCWAGRVGCCPRVSSGRAGGLVLLCSLTLILGWLGSSCPAGSWVAPQLDRWPRMKAFLFKLFCLCPLAMQSRFALVFSEGFSENRV